MFFDTHAHLNFAAFVRDRDRVIKKCLKEKVWLINVGTNFFTSQKAIEIAQNYREGVYAAVGLHPINLDTGLIKQKFDSDEFEENKESPFEKEFDYEKYKKLALSNFQDENLGGRAQSKRVVAIGEIGLDYYWKPKTKARLEDFKLRQENLFLTELRLAKELDLPIIIHCRMAHEDLLRILRKQFSIYDSKFRGVIHCFTGSWQEAEEYMKLGFLLGFNGIIFKLDLDKVVKKMPLDKMLVETDCPYLSPPRYNQERNDPLGVKFTARKISRIKKIPLQQVADQTTKNAQKLFISISR